MERKFTAEEAEKIKTNARNIIQGRKEIEEIQERMDKSEQILRRIVFGEDFNNHHLFIHYNNNSIIFSKKYDRDHYQIDLETLKIEKI